MQVALFDTAQIDLRQRRCGGQFHSSVVGVNRLA
jgi:hypothetical protein